MKAKATSPSRRTTTTSVETAVLAKSARRCTLCFHLKGDLEETRGQIAHLDQDPSNGQEDNLAWMCLDHHSLYDSTTSQHKNYTLHEVKSARSKLYALVELGDHLRRGSASPHAEADRKTFADFLNLLPSNGAVKILRSHNFDWSCPESVVDDIETFIHDRAGPEHEFLDSELENARKAFRSTCEQFSHATINRLWLEGDRYAIPSEWQDGPDQSDRYQEAWETLNHKASELCDAYDIFVRLARNRLSV